jgi:hypothetical protein
LTKDEIQDLYFAAYDLASKGGGLPVPIQKLNPLEVYYHQANIVIALQRDSYEERGYYVVPAISSFYPFFTAEPESSLWPGPSYSEWGWKPIDESKWVFEYTLKR